MTANTISELNYTRSLKKDWTKVLIAYYNGNAFTTDLIVTTVDNKTLALLNKHNGEVVNQSSLTTEDLDELVDLIEGLNLGNQETITEPVDVALHGIKYVFHLGWAD